MNKHALLLALSVTVISTLAPPLFGDFTEYSIDHFKNNVQLDTPEIFAWRKFDRIWSDNRAKLLHFKIIEVTKNHHPSISSPEMQKYFVWYAYDAADDQLTGPSYVPHFWILFTSFIEPGQGSPEPRVVEIGSSFLLPRDVNLNPGLIEQEVFFFKYVYPHGSGGSNVRQSPHAGTALIANW